MGSNEHTEGGKARKKIFDTIYETFPRVFLFPKGYQSR